MPVVAYRTEREQGRRNANFGIATLVKEGERVGVVDVHLKPGPNYITDEQWQLIQASEAGKARIKSGAIEFKSDEIPKEVIQVDDEVQSFLDLHHDAALSCAESTTDVDFLKRWLKAEKRTAIAKSIRLRLKAIAAGEL